MKDVKDFVGIIHEAAADVGGTALNVDVTAADGQRVTGWITIDPSIARDGLAVGLTALSTTKRISVRLDDRTATAVRARS